ncbi:MAG TPA: hypothetical protein VHG72_17295 [Polyangia bacterium]|nr:hypothetical protein [Polyangia bacterium]
MATVAREVFVPSPSSPAELSPQQATVMSLMSAQAYSSPATICEAFVRPATRAGDTMHGTVVPELSEQLPFADVGCPACPTSLRPQQDTVLSP